MINDPLIPTPPSKRQDTMTTPTQEKKSKTSRRAPARSAKILTLGLSTTAMLGMSSGYAFADLAQKDETINSIPAQTSPIVSPAVTPQSLTPTVPSATNAPTTTPVAVAPQQAAVIEIPIPSGAAAPGSGNSSWKKQKSSGSK